ncbi:MAG TPA: immunoglobulin domain-containing protein [Candidatus Angelobacter sp.]|nr:immunoglobulin domain-containing protein [Candidatus Angelobacter sp.]
MKKKVLLLCGVLWLGFSTGHCQTLLNSWENSPEGWSILETGSWTSVGFSSSNGVTQGSYSWKLSTTGVDYGATLQGPASTNLTMLMMNAASVSMDILPDTNTPPNFNWGIQIDMAVNQPGGVGTMSVDGGNYPGDVYSPQLGSGQVSTISWPISQAVRTALDAYPNLPVYLTLSVGGGGGGAFYIDNLRVTKIPQTQASLWVRELWDDLANEQIPANSSITNNTSTAGFVDTDPWVANPAETTNCAIMAFRPGFPNEPLVGGNMMGLPGTLDGVDGAMVQENNGFSFLPNPGQGSFWSGGDYLTRSLTPNNYINFQAAGDYWFSMTIANKPWDGASGSLDSQYVTFPSSGWGGLGFADGTTTNSDYVAIGVTGLNVYYGPTNDSNPWGATNASKALYISQGTLGQPGNVNSTVYNPLLDPSANPPDSPPNYAPPYNSEYTETNFTSGPYHINALASQTVGVLSGDYIVLLGHLKTFGDGTATLDAKYYGTGLGGNPWNTELDTNAANITWDASYSFNFSGTMTRMLLFENGQFPFYVFGFRASTNFAGVVGLDPGRIAVGPLTDTFEGYPINMTNLAVEANSFSFAAPPAGYGTLDYQWYTNGVAIPGATAQNYNIASAALTDAGVYTCVTTDPSGTWQPVTNSVTITVTHLNPPQASVQMLHDGQTFLVTYNEPNVTGADDLTHYTFNNGITISNLTLINNPNNTQVQLSTAGLPLGTKVSLSITGVTNVVGGTIGTTNFSLWTDMVRTGAANWDAWLCPAGESDNSYFNTFLPATPYPTVLQSMALNSWDGPSSGVTILGVDGFVGDDFGSRLYGWFIPPATTNYVFFISGDDGCRLSLSTNAYSTNLFVIACDSDWNPSDQWTNIEDQFPSSPHRGDGTASGPAPSGFVTDNSIASQSPATACLQNRSDQFIVAYYDSTGLPGGPAGATDSWAGAESKVEFCVPPGTQFWPNVDTNGQALIHLEAGKMYFMQLDHIQNGGGYDLGVTYKMAGQPDPGSPSASALTGSVISGTVPFAPTISINASNGSSVITYTGVLLAGTNLASITNVVGQSSAATAVSLGGPSQYVVPKSGVTTFYRTSE